MTDAKIRLEQTQSEFEHSMCKKPAEKNQPQTKPRAESTVNEEEYRYSSGIRTQSEKYHGCPEPNRTYHLKEFEHNDQLQDRDNAPYFSLRSFPIQRPNSSEKSFSSTRTEINIRKDISGEIQDIKVDWIGASDLLGASCLKDSLLITPDKKQTAKIDSPQTKYDLAKSGQKQLNLQLNEPFSQYASGISDRTHAVQFSKVQDIDAYETR